MQSLANLKCSQASALLIGGVVLVLTTLLSQGVALPQSQSLPFPSPIQSHPCQRIEDCSMFPNADCRNNQFCTCSKDHVEEDGKCYPIRLDVTSDCDVDAQCTKGLGILSRCSKKYKRCECFDHSSEGRNSSAFYKGQCYYRKMLGQKCEYSEQCKSSIIPADSVSCDVVSRTCVCLDGKTCENAKGGAGGVGSGSAWSKVAALTLVYSALKVIN